MSSVSPCLRGETRFSRPTRIQDMHEQGAEVARVVAGAPAPVVLLEFVTVQFLSTGPRQSSR